MAEPFFPPGSFYDNLDAAATALGFSNVGAVWGLAQVPWQSIEDRDAFLSALTAQNYFDVIRNGQGARG